MKIQTTRRRRLCRRDVENATPALFTRSSSFTALGRSTHTGGWSCRSRRQSRGARGRSYNNRSAEIASSAQPRLQRLNQAQVRGRQWWHWYCWPCPPGCNPVSTTYTTRTEDASPYIPKNSSPFGRSVLRRFFAERGHGDEFVDLRCNLKNFRRDAGSVERLGDLQHFRDPSICLGRQRRKLATNGPAQRFDQ